MDNFHTGKGYPVPELRPGQKIYVEVDDDFNGKGMVTVVRPTGYIVSQKSFY
jgi:beta-glucuronidase